MDMKDLLEQTIAAGASDLHLLVGKPPTLRLDGSLHPIQDAPVLTPEVLNEMAYSLLTPEQKALFTSNRELDFAYAVSNGRFRINFYYQRGEIAAALRLIPSRIRTVEELGLPTVLYEFTKLRQGLVLVTGPTGHGKSTTLAALINEINKKRDAHIVTIEDPVEYIYPEGRCLVSQREMHLDTHSWELALRAVLREDPDVVLVGEMRDYETISAALTVAETGHLVFATLHTNSASQSVDRIVDVFPAHQQGQIRAQLAGSLEGILSQRILPAIGGGRVPAIELLLASPAVQNSIREGKTHLIDNIIITSGELGMMTMENSLASLVRSGRVTMEVAEQFALRPTEFARLMRDNKI